MVSGFDFLSFVAPQGPAVDLVPGDALLDMRLRTRRAVLERHLDAAGLALGDDSVTDMYDGTLQRRFSRVRKGDWELLLPEIPRWILGDGGHARDLDAIRHGFRRKKVRFVSPQLEVPSRTVQVVLRDWNKRDDIDAALIPWSALRGLEAGEVTLEEVLSVGALPSAGDEPASPVRDQVFISYSHLDKRWFRVVEKHLAGVKDILVWSDEKIPPGRKWYDEIQNALDRAKIAVLVVTPNFVASEFIREQEVPKILEALDRGELELFWLLASPSSIDVVQLDDRQAAHNIAKPLDALGTSKRNEVLVEIATNIRAALKS